MKGILYAPGCMTRFQK